MGKLILCCVSNIIDTYTLVYKVPKFFQGGGGGGCPHNPPNSATYIFHWLIHKFLNTYNPKRTLGSFLLFLYLLIAVLTAEGGRMGCFPSALMTTSISFGSLT